MFQRSRPSCPPNPLQPAVPPYRITYMNYSSPLLNRAPGPTKVNYSSPLKSPDHQQTQITHHPRHLGQNRPHRWSPAFRRSPRIPPATAISDTLRYTGLMMTNDS